MRIQDAQQEVKNWIKQAFGDAFNGDIQERCKRFLEESMELVQAAGMSRKDADMILTYVYTRPVEPAISTEVGGAFTTLCGLANSLDIEVTEAFRIDSNKRWDNIEKIREKQEYKASIGVGRSARAQA